MGVRSRRHQIWQRGPFMVLSLAACLALAACGPLGSDDAEPTATEVSLAQPTDAASEAGTEPAVDAATDVPEEMTAEETVADDSTPDSVPVSFESTPDLEPISGTDDDPSASTPVFNDVVTANGGGPATPVSGDIATPIATGVATPQFDGPFPDGDGTSGAMPDDAEAAEETPLLVEETPAAGEGTPGASPVAVASSLDELEPVVVTSCEPEVVPEIALESTAYRTISDFNIRFGPGADCDTLAISPIGGFMPVTIVGGPVQREGEDFAWVLVEVSGETGWMVIEALEPIES